MKTIQNQNFLLFLTLRLSNYLFLTFSGGLVAFFVLELLSKGSKQPQQQQQQQQQQQLYNWISEIHHLQRKLFEARSVVSGRYKQVSFTLKK